LSPITVITWGEAMSGSKHFDTIAWIVSILIVAIAILFMDQGAALGIETMTRAMGYENRLFDNTRVHTIDIVMNNWDEFIADATSEDYYLANVVIDGEAYKNIGIRGKGNTSLSSVASMNSERYSFKIEFDHYDSTLTYYGLDKLNLNNMIHDTTMMKDYLTYTMMNEFNVNAPLCSFVYISVNGEDWGLYLAVEGVEESFLERNYGSNYGALYKPDSMDFGGGRGFGKDFDINDFFNRDKSTERSDHFDLGNKMSEMPNMPNVPGGFIPDREKMQGGKGGFGKGMGSSDVKLQYIDDNIDSYPNIWNNAKTDINKADQIRLIESLKRLTQGEEIESVVDIDQVIRFFVVHNYVCNGDSYTGSMIHNYYLYEHGQYAHRFSYLRRFIR
jgi:spore coat protein CotH